jgi:hypothetical protein
MNDNSRSHETAFTIRLDSTHTDLFQEEIVNAFADAAIPLPDDLWEFEGPPPGTFGFGAGVITLMRDAWTELCKIPGAVETLAKAVYEVCRKTKTEFELESLAPDGSKQSFKFKIVGESGEIENIVREFEKIVS